MRRTGTDNVRSTSNAIVVGAAVVALFLAAAERPATRLSAQSAAASAAIPNLTGIWHRSRTLDGKPNPPAVPTNRAVGFSEAFDDALNPMYDCNSAPIPGLLADNYDFQIIQQADRVILRYEKMDVVRTVWLEGHGHPKPESNDYRSQGYSTGRYEGGQLVIDTTKFTFDPRGYSANRFIPGSTLKKVTERFWRDGDVLKLESVTVDPLTLRQPYHYNYEWTVRTEELTPYNCDPEDARWGAQWHQSKYPADE
jgi:hypothetical protein